jgi:hypothetical protein
MLQGGLLEPDWSLALPGGFGWINSPLPLILAGG